MRNKVFKFAVTLLVIALAGLFVLHAETVAASQPPSPPSHGTVNGETWTGTLAGFSYSITPVPGTTKLGDQWLLSLAHGSVFTVSSTEVEFEIHIITDFDELMGEHSLAGPIFTGRAYTFNEPGLYCIWCKEGSRYSANIVVEVK